MKAKLVHDTGRQRWYELSEPIAIGKSTFWGGMLVDILEDTKKCYGWTKNCGNAYLEQLKDGCHMVVVSDAKRHAERLVFPGFIIDGEYRHSSNEIDGIITNSIDGGDESTIHPDEVYLRHLCMLNHLKWEGVEK